MTRIPNSRKFKNYNIKHGHPHFLQGAHPIQRNQPKNSKNSKSQTQE
jgi:hypothetical protein